MSEAGKQEAFDFTTVISDAKRVITDPVGFYRSMPTSGGYANPLIFAAVMAVIAGLIAGLLAMIGFGKASAAGGLAVGFAAVFFMPIAAVIGSFIGGAVLFVIWRLTGSEQSYEAAVRCAAYGWGIAPVSMVLAVVPYLGGAVQTLWSMFLGYTSSVEVGKVKEQLAKIIFGVLAVIFVIGGLNAERTANKWSAKAEQMEQQIENSDLADMMQKLEDGETISAEEAGRAAGEFLKNLEDFSKGLEEAATENDNSASKD